MTTAYVHNQFMVMILKCIQEHKYLYIKVTECLNLNSNLTGHFRDYGYNLIWVNHLTNQKVTFAAVSTKHEKDNLHLTLSQTTKFYTYPN